MNSKELEKDFASKNIPGIIEKLSELEMKQKDSNKVILESAMWNKIVREKEENLIPSHRFNLVQNGILFRLKEITSRYLNISETIIEKDPGNPPRRANDQNAFWKKLKEGKEPLNRLERVYKDLILLNIQKEAFLNCYLKPQSLTKKAAIEQLKALFNTSFNIKVIEVIAQKEESIIQVQLRKTDAIKAYLEVNMPLGKIALLDRVELEENIKIEWNAINLEGLRNQIEIALLDHYLKRLEIVKQSNQLDMMTGIMLQSRLNGLKAKVNSKNASADEFLKTLAPIVSGLNSF